MLSGSEKMPKPFNETEISRIRLEIVLNVIAQKQPTVFAVGCAQDIVDADPYVKKYLEDNELSGIFTSKLKRRVKALMGEFLAEAHQ
jgi:hypothetical protein